MACVCGKNVSFILNLRNHFTHVVMGRAGKLHAWFTGAGLTPVNLFMAQTADQNACSLRQTDTFKRLSHTPATPNGKVTPSPRGRDGRQQRGSRTGRLNHRVWIVSLYLFPCDKYKALRWKGLCFNHLFISYAQLYASYIVDTKYLIAELILWPKFSNSRNGNIPLFSQLLCLAFALSFYSSLLPLTLPGILNPSFLDHFLFHTHLIYELVI